MQKNNRSYTFLLTRKSRSKIQIRRIEISKNFLNASIAGIFLTLGMMTAAFTGILKFETPKALAKNQIRQTNASQSVQNSDKSFDYSRPAQFTRSLGGPADFQLSNVADAEENEMETQLRTIEVSSSPEFLPTMWAHLGKINNEYGNRRNPFGGGGSEFHGGMDIDGDKGDIIVAPANGVVSKAGWQGGYGNLIEIDHGNGLTTRYGHLSRIDVKIGDQIGRGQLIGLLGSTGRSTGPHLHFEIRLNDRAINPRRFLPPSPTEIASN